MFYQSSSEKVTPMAQKLFSHIASIAHNICISYPQLGCVVKMLTDGVTSL